MSSGQLVSLLQLRKVTYVSGAFLITRSREIRATRVPQRECSAGAVSARATSSDSGTLNISRSSSGKMVLESLAAG
jgi:hypothetical protein